MSIIAVEVQDDHIGLLSRARPVTALAELIWNALDADATRVEVRFIENALGGIEAIHVLDNGHGLPYREAAKAFGRLGGSWKEQARTSPSRKRTLHGRFGKGRFRAFALGNRVEWRSTYRSEDEIWSCNIVGHALHPGRFELTGPERLLDDCGTGMLVEIADLPWQAEAWRGAKAAQDLTDIFALYLRQYPEIKITHDSIPLDTATVEDHVMEYDLGELVLESGERMHAALTVVEWLLPGKRGIVLCDMAGFALHPPTARLVFRGFSYTAYLKSDHLARLDREGLLALEEMSLDLRQMLEAARSALRSHFSRREKEKAVDLVERWREEGAYPYGSEHEGDGKAKDLFNMFAAHAHQYCDVGAVTPRARRLVLHLLKALVESDPARAASLLNEQVTFAADHRERMMSLLERF